MIETHRIVKRFGRVTAVAHASFTVPDRTVCGFLGPNGAGKTTTIRMLVGVLAPDEGWLRINGIDPAVDGARARRSIGYLAEESPLHPELAVEEFITHRARLYGVRRSSRAAAVGSAIERCQLQAVRRRLCGQLSKGYRQRCGLAAALVHDPSVLVLDEPTSGFDPAQLLEFRKLVRDLAADRTVLLSSHVLAEIEAVCDSAVLIDRGHVAAEGTLAELRARGAGAATLIVEVDRDLTQALCADKRTLGAERVRLPDGWWRIELRASAVDDGLAQATSATVARTGSALRRLEWAHTTLEAVFHRILAAGPGSGGDPSANGAAR